MMTFCTLFNVTYLDKGLALYHSLTNTSKKFCLYVLAMDDKCYEILSDLNKPNLVPIRLEEFESEELLRVKPNRKRGEYFWTCSSWLISYVIDTYHPDYCTYLDADLYLYSDPSVIIDEMIRKNASVQIVSHHFHPVVAENTSNIVGKYCVEFDTFKNDENGRMLLDIWKKQVIEHCSIDGDGIHWGDQKYQDNWVDDYPFVVATGNVGAGLAPWNICLYKLEDVKDGNIIVSRYGRKAPLLFYHFENIVYYDEATVNVSIPFSWGFNKEFRDMLYIPYLNILRDAKKMLKEKYDIDILITSHPGVETQEKKQTKSLTRRLYDKIFVKRTVFLSIRIFFNMSLPQRIYSKYSILSF